MQAIFARPCAVLALLVGLSACAPTKQESIAGDIEVLQKVRAEAFESQLLTPNWLGGGPDGEATLTITTEKPHASQVIYYRMERIGPAVQPVGGGRNLATYRLVATDVPRMNRDLDRVRRDFVAGKSRYELGSLLSTCSTGAPRSRNATLTLMLRDIQRDAVFLAATAPIPAAAPDGTPKSGSPCEP